MIEQGLYDKYEVTKDGEPVEDCFVLEPATDPAARAALYDYANYTPNMALEADLREWLGELDAAAADRETTDE